MKKIYLIAAIAAALCGLLVFRYTSDLQRQVDAQNPETPMTQVVVAAEDIPARTVITEEMLTLVDYPTEYVHSDAAVSVEDVVGKLSNGDIVEGETILLGTIGEPGEMNVGLAYEVPEGMRAISLGVEVDTGVSYFVCAGDHVDLIDYARTSEDLVGKASYLLEDVEVLAVGDITQSQDTNYSYVTLTLALSPEDCLKLVPPEYDDEDLDIVVAVLRQRTE